MRLIYLLVVCILSTSISAQVANLSWANSSGGSSEDWGFSNCTDNSGNVYTAGFFEGTVDFNPGSGTNNLTSNGFNDCFIQKLDANGNFVWAKSFGGISGDLIYSIYTDASGNIYTTGTFEGTVDFDPGSSTFNMTSYNFVDVFILKLSSSGNFIWAKQMGGLGVDVGHSITVDALGNIYTTGNYQDTVDFDPGAAVFNLACTDSSCYFIQKLNSNGNFVWAKSLDATNKDGGRTVTTDAVGNVYLTGDFEGTVDFNPNSGTFNLTSNGWWDYFILKLNSNGNFIWAKSTGGVSWDEGRSIIADLNGNIYLTGFFLGQVDFDPGSGVSNLIGYNINAFVQKLDTSGSFVWAKSVSSSSSNLGFSIAMGDAGSVLISGYYLDTADFNPGTGNYYMYSNGNADCFIQKLDASGNFIWAASMGGTGDDAGLSIATNTLGNVFGTGFFEGTADFDPQSSTYNKTSNGFSDVFSFKLGQCQSNSSTDVITACNTYKWIDGNIYSSSNNTATHTMPNSQGCDSVISLDLTINQVDVSVTVNNLSVTANATGVSYRWLDCNNNFAFITGETAQTFTATTNGDYAVEVNDGNCTDTSNCVNISSVGIGSNDLATEISFFPNPFFDVVKIDFGRKYAAISIDVYDSNGRKISSFNIVQTDRVEIDIPGPNGIYYLRVTADDKSFSGKLIKQ